VAYGYVGSMRTKDGQASLELPETRAAIGRAMPMLTAEFARQELSVVGGLGVTA
jgi:hypothetical protein